MYTRHGGGDRARRFVISAAALRRRTGSRSVDYFYQASTMNFRYKILLISYAGNDLESITGRRAACWRPPTPVSLGRQLAWQFAPTSDGRDRAATSGSSLPASTYTRRSHSFVCSTQSWTRRRPQAIPQAARSLVAGQLSQRPRFRSDSRPPGVCTCLTP